MPGQTASYDNLIRSSGSDQDCASDISPVLGSHDWAPWFTACFGTGFLRRTMLSGILIVLWPSLWQDCRSASSVDPLLTLCFCVDFFEVLDVSHHGSLHYSLSLALWYTVFCDTGPEICWTDQNLCFSWLTEVSASEPRGILHPHSLEYVDDIASEIFDVFHCWVIRFAFQLSALVRCLFRYCTGFFGYRRRQDITEWTRFGRVFVQPFRSLRLRVSMQPLNVLVASGHLIAIMVPCIYHLPLSLHRLSLRVFVQVSQ